MDINHKTSTERFPFSSYPDGWYALAWAADIVSSEVQYATICGEEVIFFLNSNNTFSVFDAYCPHLGAHLGYGGVVENGCIRCPFHGWKFSFEGDCLEIPGAERPMKVKTRVWHSEVVNGMLLIWYSKNNPLPIWSVQPVDLTGWCEPSFTQENSWLLQTHVQEIAENGVDLAHFSTVHGAVAPGTISELEFSEYVCSWISESQVQYREESSVVSASLKLYGLGIQQVHAKVVGTQMEYKTFLYSTPVDHNKIIIRLAISVKHQGNEKRNHALIKFLLPLTADELKKDFPIWENKKYVSRPYLSLADGPINGLRNWAKQFYVSSSY